MKIYLAPMEGVIDHHMRSLLSLFGGLDICVTEFIRVNDHTLPEKVFYRYCPELKNNHNTPPVRVQLLGSNPQALASNAKKAALLGAPGIDLNFGCPAKTVNRSRGGACLLNETALIADIVKQVRDATPAEIPVSVKIRLGYEARNSYINNAIAIEAAGANELIIHARSKADGYKPPAYWECIAEARQHISIPVIANGEIWTVEDFTRCKQITGCDDFMLGRGILAQPDLALAIQSSAAGMPYSLKRWDELVPHLESFFAQSCLDYPERFIGNRLKQWLHYLRTRYQNADHLFERIKKIRDPAVIIKEIRQSAIYDLTPNEQHP